MTRIRMLRWKQSLMVHITDEVQFLTSWPNPPRTQWTWPSMKSGPKSREEAPLQQWWVGLCILQLTYLYKRVGRFFNEENLMFATLTRPILLAIVLAMQPFITLTKQPNVRATRQNELNERTSCRMVVRFQLVPTYFVSTY